MNLEELLRSKGHEVAIYAMQYPENEVSPWSKYWPKNMGAKEVFTRPFGSREVKAGFLRLLEDFKPEVVHLNNIHTQLSPVVAQLAHERGIRVVWTLHDTKLVCPCYTCMRNGRWCEECFTHPTSVIKHRCMPGALPGAVIGYLEMRKWNRRVLQEYTDLFLPPSKFMMDTLVKAGFSAEKFRVLCNFIDVKRVENPSFKKGDYYVYLGRVNEVKGVRTLCRAAACLDKKLIVIGGGELLEVLREEYRDSSQIVFMGQAQWEEFRPVLAGARFMVIPSEWSENNPLTVIEAQSLGTPVLGAHIGGIPELIEECRTGMTFAAGDVEDLRTKIGDMFAHSFDYREIAVSAVKRYSSEAYVEQLLHYYKDNK
jgi:glycosyltransferase involved in cell wall biosynthesis